ncbi:MAG: apolipoprotein N-acyltransferase [Betaproteobacteria bacterium]|nr:apolipoprotein N-acyltransferase [Betaproteobacteria bacterium]
MRAFWFYPLLFLAGVLTVFAYAPFGLSVLLLPCLGLLFHFWKTGTARGNLLAGLAWGTGAFFAGIGWLTVALARYGGMPWPLAALAILLFSAFLALYPAFAGGLFARLRGAAWWRNALLVGALWSLGEWLRGWVFTGFPWLALGYTQTPPSPLAGYAPLLGVYGLSFLVAFLVALIVFALHPRRRLAVALIVALSVCAAGFALRQIAWTAPDGTPLTVALAQTNVPQEMKWDARRAADMLQLNAEAVAQAKARLLVLPESSLPMLAEDVPPGYLQELADVGAARGGDSILGIFTRDAQGRIYNSALSLGYSPSQVYRKSHLVPFGEYSPPLFGWFYALANIPMADQTRGAADQKPFAIAGQKIAVNICYEDLFGEELIRKLPEASLMLNMSNLAWYGDSHAQPQHLQIARMRALETGRPMLRATNTGMTAWIEPDGQVMAVLPTFTRATLEVEVRGYAGLTPYARWGNYAFLLLAVLVVLSCGVMTKRAAPASGRGA